MNDYFCRPGHTILGGQKLWLRDFTPAPCGIASGKDIPLIILTRSSALSKYAQSVVSSPGFMRVVASIKMKQDAVTLAQMNVCDQLSALPAHDKEALYATFPRSPAAFRISFARWKQILSLLIGKSEEDPSLRVWRRNVSMFNAGMSLLHCELCSRSNDSKTISLRIKLYVKCVCIFSAP